LRWSAAPPQLMRECVSSMAQNHALLLGKLLGNLQSLETLLRVYLMSARSDPAGTKPPGADYWKLVAGDEVPEDPFSNYDTLSTLINKFNSSVPALGPSQQVDTAVVGLRDLLAHGRVSADEADETRLAILKFAKPVTGRVRVVASAVMTEEWFAQNVAFVREQIERVASALDPST
jgi:hypothetical protein